MKSTVESHLAPTIPERRVSTNLINDRQHDRLCFDSSNSAPPLKQVRVRFLSHGAQSIFDAVYLRNEPLNGSGDHSDEQTHGNNEVWSLRPVKLISERPSDCSAIQALGLLTRLACEVSNRLLPQNDQNNAYPDIVTVWAEKNIPLRIDDRYHYD